MMNVITKKYINNKKEIMEKLKIYEKFIEKISNETSQISIAIDWYNIIKDKCFFLKEDIKTIKNIIKESKNKDEKKIYEICLEMLKNLLKIKCEEAK